MILLDTSVLIDGLTGSRRCAAALRRAIDRGERMLVPALVLYEWLRGPRLPEEIAAQEALFPRELAVPFSAEEAVLAAEIYSAVRRARGRELDLAIAACALARDAEVWTLNVSDCDDIPGLRVSSPG